MHIEKRSLFESLESRQLLSVSPGVELEAGSEPFAAITANPTAAVSDVNGTYIGTASIDGGKKIPLTITITDKNNQKRVKVICGGLRPKFLVTFSQSGPHYMIANYPVGNGKSILIQIKDGQKITIDGSADIPILGPIQFSGSGTRSGSLQSTGTPIDTAAKANPLVGTYKGELEPIGLPRTFYDVTAIVEKKQGTDKHRLQLRIKVPDFGEVWINYQIGPDGNGKFNKQVAGGPELDGKLTNTGKLSLTIHFTDSRQSFVSKLNPVNASFSSAFSPTAISGVNGTYNGTAQVDGGKNQDIEIFIRDSSQDGQSRVKFKKPIKIGPNREYLPSFRVKFRVISGGYIRADFLERDGGGYIQIKNGKIDFHIDVDPLSESPIGVDGKGTLSSSSLMASSITRNSPTAAGKNPLIGSYEGELTRAFPHVAYDLKVTVSKIEDSKKLKFVSKITLPGLGTLIITFVVKPNEDGKFERKIGESETGVDHVFDGKLTKTGKLKFQYYVPPVSPLTAEAKPK